MEIDWYWMPLLIAHLVRIRLEVPYRATQLRRQGPLVPGVKELPQAIWDGVRARRAGEHCRAAHGLHTAHDQSILPGRKGSVPGLTGRAAKAMPPACLGC